MDTTTNIYIEKITEFSRLLRREGFAVGLGESEDACRALEYVGFADRHVVKAALRTVVAKSQQELTAFDRVFDSFFISVEQKQENIRRQLEQQQQLEQQVADAHEELKINDQPIELSDEMYEVYATMPESERQKLRRFMNRYKDSYERDPNLYDNFIHSVFMRSLMEQQMLLEDAALGQEEVDPDLALLFRDISQITDAEIPRAIAIIQRVTQQINGELSAKRTRGGHSGMLDFKRTIRKGLETGGSFNRLRYKRRRAKKRRLVLLCDVSGSMIQFSEFALRFIKSMADVAESSRTFLFSEGMVEVDAFALQNMDAFRSYVRSSGLYGKGTDLGTALERLCGAKPAVLGPSTTLLILSDAKTIDLTRAEHDILRAKQQAGKVVWLNPIPRRKWDRIRSVTAMSTLCQMVPCSTLNELARECRKLVTK